MRQLQNVYQYKRENGQYFTRRNIFKHKAFYAWAKKANIQNELVLEPFAGANYLIEMLKEVGLCNNYKSFDINPQNKFVIKQDTLINFPKGYNVVITNPPYLAKNSATRRGICYIDNIYDDLYKYALEKCLNNVGYVGAIIPASFLNSGLFRNRLAYYISLPYTDMFLDTEHPVCLALFEPFVKDTIVYEKDKKIGYLRDLEKFIPVEKSNIKVKFNSIDGNIGLIGIDNTISNTISFVKSSKIPKEKIKPTSRSLTRIKVDKKINIELLNEKLEFFRYKTSDIFLTPFKGIRKDGKFRRRLDFTFAKKLILSLD